MLESLMPLLISFLSKNGDMTTRCSVQGLKKVSGEFATIFITYNLRHTITIFGVKKPGCKAFRSNFRSIWADFKHSSLIFFCGLERDHFKLS